MPPRARATSGSGPTHEGPALGERRLLDVVTSRRTVALPELLDAVFAAVRGFSGGEQADEQTLLVARAL